jgi:DNA-binding NarL/FixJ family response regulator/signal transduction histidine kinase
MACLPINSSWYNVLMRPVVPPRMLDAAIALGLGLFGALGGLAAHTQGRYVPAAGVLVLTVMGLVLYPRRRYPGAVLAAVTVCVVVLAVLRASLEGAFLPVLVACYSAAVYGSRRLLQCLTVLAAGLLFGVGIPYALGPHGWLRAHFPAPTSLAAGGALVVGMIIRRQFAVRDAAVAALAERTELIAARQSEQEQRARLAERLRIARELHDIVAHHLSVVVIQAQAARRMADVDAARARTAMADVERTGRTALEEMRHLLGLLRTGEAADPGAASDLAAAADQDPAGAPGAAAVAGAAAAYGPAFGLADVDDLAERARGVGLPVTVLRQGAVREVPEDVGLTVYRVVQEALTNVLKHAGTASAVVSLSFADDLDVLITDDGRGAAAGDDGELPGAGLGTSGMTERVAAVGGTLTAGPRPGGGYQVRARIPLSGVSALGASLWWGPRYGGRTVIRVLLADDQPLVRTGFRMILDTEPDISVAGEAGDGDSAVRECLRLRPDVTVMDIRMPVRDGISATAEIAGQTRVLVLTTFHLDEYVVNALRAGASGFLLKDVDAAKLAEAIRVVHAGNAIVDPSVTRRLLDRFARLPVPVERVPACGLTARETDVLRLVARGLSNAEIAAELVVTETTVKTHVHHLLTKLNARDRVQLVIFAYDAGFASPS